jgi:hypothetical protein
LIDFRAKNLPKPTSFWCRRGLGRRLIEKNV